MLLCSIPIIERTFVRIIVFKPAHLLTGVDDQAVRNPDAHLESIVGDFVYDDYQNRAVAVHSSAMIKALRNLYDAGKLADEIEGKSQ